MKTIAEELFAIGLSGIPIVHQPEDPGLSSEDVDNYAEQYERTLNKAQNLLGYRPYNVETGETF